MQAALVQHSKETVDQSGIWSRNLKAMQSLPSRRKDRLYRLQKKKPAVMQSKIIKNMKIRCRVKYIRVRKGVDKEESKS